jgi:hypothetical protein
MKNTLMDVLCLGLLLNMAVSMSLVGQGFGRSRSNSPVDRDTLRKQYDLNEDGRLSASEREKMRSDRGAQMRENRNRGRGREMRFIIPEDVLAFYDTDKDGKISRQETENAMRGLGQKMAESRKKYDKDGDGDLSESEGDLMRQDVSAGKVTGVSKDWAGWFASSRNRGRSRGGRGSRNDDSVQGRFGRFDKDDDGKLNQEERQAAREALK